MSESSVSTLSPEVSSVRYLCRSLWQLPGHRPVCLGQGHQLKVKSTIRHCCRGQLLQQKGCNVSPNPLFQQCGGQFTVPHFFTGTHFGCSCATAKAALWHTAKEALCQCSKPNTLAQDSRSPWQPPPCQSFRTHSCPTPAWPEGLCRMTLNTSAKAMQSQPMAIQSAHAKSCKQ